MHTEKEIVIRRYFEELFNRGKVELVAELLAPDYVNQSTASPAQSRGPDGVVDVVLALRRAFPDLEYQILDLVEGDSAVAVRTRMTGTHLGDFFGAPPTGRSIDVTQITIERFRGNRIVEHHRLTDELTLLKQLGLVTA
jgi:steroid delta-isomerase-like uncharacterized protein